MASEDDDARDAELARLSGSELMAHLRTTCRRTDYDAAARVLDARDRRLALANAVLDEVRPALAAALAEVNALREEYVALKGALHGTRIKAAARSAEASAIVAPAPAPRGEPRAEGAGEKGGNFIDLCSSDDEEEEWEEGEFRPHVAVVSCKRKASASACSSDEDEDDKIPLSQLWKKRWGAEPGADGEPKNGNGDAQANSVRPLGDDLPEISPVIREGAEARAGQRAGASEDPKVATFVQGRGDGKSGKDGGMSRAMLSPRPTGSAVGNSSQKNSSKANSVGPLGNDLPETPPVIMERPKGRVGGSEEPKVAAFVQGRGNGKSAENGGVSRAGFAVRTGSQKDFSKVDDGGVRIAEKEGSFAGPVEDTPSQVRTPTLTARKIVESARAGTETPNEHTRSEPDGFYSMVLRAIREQEKTNGQVYNKKVFSGANGIGDQDGKLSSCERREVSDGGSLRASDKMVSAALPNNQLSLHSGQTSVEGPLPSAITRHWKCDSDVFTSCLENKEICMQAACALYRQRKLTIQPTEGGRSGRTGLNKGDADRAAELVEFLLDGKLQGPLKRPEELVKHDSAALNLLERVVLQCSEQLFDIYRNKKDPFFR
ncbi:uncharacterized protein LOC133884503 [Phragmites australis]|uniref:uncharacterized protein LOC133884503 n=1 Tax=Phragmites australis TaxID=29695 RepID=UPI002D76E496|nr:uncharacterized protein LOC133884503 [Phragmites australis]